MPMARPLWSGTIQISLVGFAVEIYPATSTTRPISFHEIDRNTLDDLVKRDVPIAAICAATIPLARTGLFRNRRHTSNGRLFLERNAPGYETATDYVDDVWAVTDRGVISASGLGAVEFARESGQTLVGFLRGDTMNIYSHAERIRQ